MRTMWRGAIAFGLVNIGVRIHAATADHDYRFHQVHREDHGRIQHKRVCSECGREVDYDDIVKGYETADGKLVVLDSEDFRTLPIRTDRAIDVLECVPAEQVDPTYFQNTYYLAPEKNAGRPYALLREALKRTERMAVVKITMRQREVLAAVRPVEDVLVLHTMLWPDEIRTPDFDVAEDDPGLSSRELDMAASLVEAMAADFDATAFTDDYQRALGDLIEAKAEGTEPPEETVEAPEEEQVVDLTTALERSIRHSGATGPSRSRPSQRTDGGGRRRTKTAAATSTTSRSRTRSGKTAGARSRRRG